MTKHEREAAKGYSYTVSNEDIRRYMKVPAEEKLQWLEEANHFLAQALTGKKREIWQKFRRGEI